MSSQSDDSTFQRAKFKLRSVFRLKHILVRYSCLLGNRQVRKFFQGTRMPNRLSNLTCPCQIGTFQSATKLMNFGQRGLLAVYVPVQRGTQPRRCSPFTLYSPLFGTIFMQPKGTHFASQNNLTYRPQSNSKYRILSNTWVKV